MFFLTRLQKLPWVLIISSATGLGGCGSEPNVVRAPAAETPAKLAAKVDAVPRKCSSTATECLPPTAWVRKLCGGVHPDIALYLFRSGTAWRRLYMVAQAPAYNASGGVSLLGEDLAAGEEVLALRRHDGSSGSIQVGDSSGYDVLRWNGACATVHDADFTTTPPRFKRNARVEFTHLSEAMQSTLMADPAISASYAERRRTCHGVSLGIVSKECEQWDRKLVSDIVRYVRTGAPLPEQPVVP